MRKWMLCVLALAMVGVTFDTAEAGGRRGRSYSSSSSSYGGYWGGGNVSYEGGASGMSPVGQGIYYSGTVQYANPPVTSSEYVISQNGEMVSTTVSAPATGATVLPASYQVTSSGTPVMGGPVGTPVYQYPANYAPASYPVYMQSSGFGFGASCSGGG